VVLPAFNEARTIEEEALRFHRTIVEPLPGSELIVAEDGSTDGTHEILQRLAQAGKIVHVTSEVRKGYIRALLDAFRACRNPYVFFSDTGNKHDPAEFWKLYEVRHEYDLIVGRKTDRKDQKYRQLLTWGYNAILRSYFGVSGVHDADSGFRLMNRSVVDHVLGTQLIFRNLVGSEIVIRAIHAGLKYHEIPVSYEGREGESRGLPLAKIPRISLQTLGALSRLRVILNTPDPPLETELRRPLP
jgi:glycosyltransferase involved in cell wall biosynthesis